MLNYTQQAAEDLALILAGLECYGEFVYTYKRNRTNWYAFYDKCGEGDFVVNRITNNWNVLLPRL